MRCAKLAKCYVNWSGHHGQCLGSRVRCWEGLFKHGPGTIGCTPNSVPMVFVVFNLGILGDNLPINTHVI